MGTLRALKLNDFVVFARKSAFGFPFEVVRRATDSRTWSLPLQLLFLRASESMGNHDSNVVGAGRVG
jgi:hypothetical protein